jgi:hypothetical protein
VAYVKTVEKDVHKLNEIQRPSITLRMKTRTRRRKIKKRYSRRKLRQAGKRTQQKTARLFRKIKTRYSGTKEAILAHKRRKSSFLDETRDLWQRMDNSFYSTIGFTQLAYRSTNKISYVVVAMGVIFLIHSIASVYIFHKLDQWSVLSGGLSLVSFVSLFFTRPQKDIQKNTATALGNLAQIQMIYKLYSLQFASLADGKKENPYALYQTSKDFRVILEDYVQLVQKYIEDYRHKSTKANEIRTENSKLTEMQEKTVDKSVSRSTDRPKKLADNTGNGNGSIDCEN